MISIEIPVHRPCIHRIPVHSANNHSMDGNAGHFNHVFPSTDLVYADLPSTAPIITEWTGMQDILPSDSRPQSSYTRNPRPRHQYSQNGRECRTFYPRIPVHRARIHGIPVHGANNHKMDGNVWYFTLGFPSTVLVYLESPSICRVCSIHAFINLLSSIYKSHAESA